VANINLTVTRGDTLLLRFRFRNTVTKLPIDITGWQLYLTFKPDLALPDTSSSAIQQVYDLAATDAQSLLFANRDAVNGDVTLRLGPEKTSIFQNGRKYSWDLQRVVEVDDGTAVVGHDAFTYAQGQATVAADATLTYAVRPIGTLLP
jgi:hypothetical protein